MPDVITQLGVGGIIALLVIREVLSFLSKRKENGRRQFLSIGEMSPEHWLAEQRKVATDVLVTVIVPILANQTSILAEKVELMREMQRNNHEVGQKIAIILDRMSHQSHS